jgi:hypothetical protein
MKRVRTDEEHVPIQPIAPFDQCPDLMIALVRVCILSQEDQEGIVWLWRQVSMATHDSVAHVVRELLRPRLHALEVALAAWKDAPLATPFSYPEPRGPLPMMWVELVQYGDRCGARPRGARQGETVWFRPLFVWAISYVLFPVVRDADRVNIAKAVLDAARVVPPMFEPAFQYFTGNHDWVDSEEKHPYDLKWSRAVEYSPQALLSTFSTGSYENSLNMAEPGNHQRFTRALLDQMNGFVPAIAFLLLWMQHVKFNTYVTDETFLCALHELVLELVFEWRCMVERGLRSRNAFYLWFGDRPETLAYNPIYLKYVPSNRLAQQFGDPEHRRRLIETATRGFNFHVANALQKIGK